MGFVFGREAGKTGSRAVPAELTTLRRQHPAGPQGLEPGPAGRYLVPLPLHLLELQHDGVHAVLVHLAVLPQRGALQLQVLLLLQVLRAQGGTDTRTRPLRNQGRQPAPSHGFPGPARPSLTPSASALMRRDLGKRPAHQLRSDADLLCAGGVGDRADTSVPS